MDWRCFFPCHWLWYAFREVSATLSTKWAVCLVTDRKHGPTSRKGRVEAGGLRSISILFNRNPVRGKKSGKHGREESGEKVKPRRHGAGSLAPEVTETTRQETHKGAGLHMHQVTRRRWDTLGRRRVIAHRWMNHRQETKLKTYDPSALGPSYMSQACMCNDNISVDSKRVKIF